MNGTRSIYRNGAWFFLPVPVFALWGFWPSYFSPSARPVSVYEHLHGAAMIAWMALLIVQPLMIRSGNRAVHRAVGRVSYALVPLIVASTLVLANYQVGRRGLSLVGSYLLLLQLTLLVQFVIFYGLAVAARPRPDVHARYMICTALPLIDPIFARIIGIYVPPAGIASQVATFALTDVVLLALIAWDWRASGRRDVFLPILPVVLVLQLAVFLLVKSESWAVLAAWFMALPIS